MKKYTDSHEWILVEDNVGKVGISQFAKDELGEIVYIELPQVGVQVKRGEEIVVLESTKAAADIYSPVSGTVTAINENASSLINDSPEGDGWLFSIELSNLDELDSLLSNENYENLIGV